MELLRDYPGKMFIGMNNGERVYLSKPYWSCGWYWGFGYVGNKDCSYHLSGLEKGLNMYGALKKHFEDTFIVRESQMWQFCEIVKTIYHMKETAEVFGRGGVHYTTNPCKDLIIDTDLVDRINSKIIPELIDKMYNILESNVDNVKLFKKVESLFIKGDTSKVIKFMNENSLTPDDVKKHLSKSDFNIIHGYYWTDYHKNKKK